MTRTNLSFKFSIKNILLLTNYTILCYITRCEPFVKWRNSTTWSAIQWNKLSAKRFNVEGVRIYFRLLKTLSIAIKDEIFLVWFVSSAVDVTDWFLRGLRKEKFFNMKRVQFRSMGSSSTDTCFIEMKLLLQWGDEKRVEIFKLFIYI